MFNDNIPEGKFEKAELYRKMLNLCESCVALGDSVSGNLKYYLKEQVVDNSFETIAFIAQAYIVYGNDGKKPYLDSARHNIIKLLTELRVISRVDSVNAKRKIAEDIIRQCLNCLNDIDKWARSL